MEGKQRVQGPGELGEGRKVVELRLTPKTLGCLTSDSACTNLGTGNLEIEWTISKKASATFRLLQRELLPQQQRTRLHLSTPAFLLLNIVVNESCNKLYWPKNRACRRVIKESGCGIYQSVCL